MSEDTKRSERGKRRMQSQTPSQHLRLPSAPQNIVQQLSPTGQQQQWLPTNAGGTPNFVKEPQMAQGPPQCAPSASSSSGQLHQQIAANIPMGYRSCDTDQHLSTTITTTTTMTTTQTNQRGSFHPPSHTQRDADYATGQLQNLQLQPQSGEQPALTQAPQLQPPPVTLPIETPVIQQLPSAQPQQQRPTLQNQDHRYPVTFEQRRTAFFQWQSQHSLKPQRTLDRTMQDYMSGKKDKEMYELLLKQQQSQQIQIDLPHEQLQASRGQKRRERQREREITQQQSQQNQIDRQTQQNSDDSERRSQKVVRDQKRQERLIERELREQRRLHQTSVMPRVMHGLGAYSGFGGSSSMHGQSTMSIGTVQMITQQGVTQGSGEYRKKTIAEGDEAVRRLNDRVQIILTQIGVCPMGFEWLPVSDGWLCCGK
jgi:hypothetical protein